MLPAFGNDPNAWVKDVKPFLIKGASQFRSSGPYERTSRKYAREFNGGQDGRLCFARRSPTARSIRRTRR